jgi:hypothetical protein
MQLTAPSSKTSRRNHLTGHAEFTVVAIHDGYLAKERAQGAQDGLEAALPRDCRMRAFLWSFDKLSVPGLRAMSIHLAAAADMIIVATDEEAPLPGHLTQWLDSCRIEFDGKRPVIVALHQEVQDCCNTPRQLCACLEPLARCWQTPFFCNETFDPGMIHGPAVRFLQEDRGDDLPRRHSTFDASIRSWGINE